MSEVNLDELSLSNLACWLTKYQTELDDADKKYRASYQKINEIRVAGVKKGCLILEDYDKIKS